MINDDDHLITETEFILKIFQEYFKKILNGKYVLEIDNKYQILYMI